jgi:hypothetical protein
VFLCFAQATQGEADPIEAAIRAKYPASDVLVAHVVDLHTLPGMLRGMAERILQTEYEKAVAALPSFEGLRMSGETAEDYVVILPDWDGAFVKALGFSEDVSKRLGVAVFGRDGTVAGLVQGEGAASAALGVLAGLSA